MGLYLFSLKEMKRRIISPLKQAVAARKRFRVFILSKNCMHKSRRAYSENKFRKHITCQEFAVLLFTLALDYLNLKYDQILLKIFIISPIGYFNVLNIPLSYELIFNLRQICIECTGGTLILIIKGLDPLYM